MMDYESDVQIENLQQESYDSMQQNLNSNVVHKIEKQQTCQDEFELVAIDIQQFDQDIIVRDLLNQMQTVGFCLVTNVADHDEDELLKATKAFFQIPLEIRMKLALNHFKAENQNIYHGFFPFIMNDLSHKEFYDMGRPYEDLSEWERNGNLMYEKNPWIDDSYNYNWIFDVWTKQFQIMHRVSLQLINYLAMGMGKTKDYFDPWFKNECHSEFRAIHYLSRDQTIEGQSLNSRLVTPEHCDSGFITLLSTFMYPGLQVEINGEYKSIKPIKNAIIVNLGETLQMISNYKIKATRHRVLDIGRERYSSPFFLIPKFSARISPNHLSSNRAICQDYKYEEDTQNQNEMQSLKPYGQLICEKMTNTFGEFKGFKVPTNNYDYTLEPGRIRYYQNLFQN